MHRLVIWSVLFWMEWGWIIEIEKVYILITLGQENAIYKINIIGYY